MRREQIGDCTLYLGDCREVLPTAEGVSAIVFDPPYGIAHASNYGASWQGRQIANDGDTAVRDWVIAWAEPLPVACFGTWKVEPPPSARGCLVWDKGPAFGMGDLSFPWKPSFELIHILGKGWNGTRDEGVLRGPVVVSWESKGRAHPHEKPVWLCESLIGKLPHAGLICDPTMGTGTTGIACVRLGRPFIGIEIDERHYETALRRIEAAYRQGDMFRAQPAKAEQMVLVP